MLEDTVWVVDFFESAGWSVLYGVADYFGEGGEEVWVGGWEREGRDVG